MLVVSQMLVSLLDNLSVLVPSAVSVSSEHLEVVAGFVVTLYFLFVIFVVHAAVVPICNVKTTGITIIIVVRILSHFGGFMWTMHATIILLICMLPYLLGVKLVE